MRQRFYFVLVLFLFMMILSLGGVSSRHLATNSDFAVNDHHGKVNNSQSLQVNERSNEGTKKGLTTIEEAGKYKRITRVGSSPPSCEDKCYGCNPCEPIQVPTTSSRVGVQYTNYEPEGWKCKCGPTFYSP